MTTAIIERASGADLRRVAPAYVLERLLREFESLLRQIPAAAYTAAPESGEATIARHVSRCLDSIETLLSARAARVVVYGPTDGGVPGDLAAGLRRIEELRDLLVNWPGCSLDGIICVEQPIWPLGLDERGWSTLGNELAFVVNHIVDRQKIIERAMQSFGIPVPKGFGSMELQPLRARSSVPGRSRVRKRSASRLVVRCQRALQPVC